MSQSTSILQASTATNTANHKILGLDGDSTNAKIVSHTTLVKSL